MTQVYVKAHVLMDKQELIGRYDKEIENSIGKSKFMAENCRIWFTRVNGNKSDIGYQINLIIQLVIYNMHNM